jgi:hypothetical protein
MRPSRLLDGIRSPHSNERIGLEEALEQIRKERWRLGNLPRRCRGFPNRAAIAATKTFENSLHQSSAGG